MEQKLSKLERAGSAAVAVPAFFLAASSAMFSALSLAVGVDAFDGVADRFGTIPPEELTEVNYFDGTERSSFITTASTTSLVSGAFAGVSGAISYNTGKRAITGKMY